MTTLKVRNRPQLPFGIVPNALLEEKRLSLQARALAAWLVGRGDGFEIRIEALKKMLGITDKIWVSARRELEYVGWWTSRKFRVPSEKEKNQGRPVFRWEHEFEFLEGSTCIPPFSRDASCMDAKGGDKQTRNNHEDLNQKEKTTTSYVDVEDFAEGEGGKEEGCTLLKKVGINQGVAKALAHAHSVSRIKEVVDLAREKNRSNMPGFIVTGLREGWTAAGNSRGSNIDDLIGKYEAEERKVKNG